MTAANADLETTEEEFQNSPRYDPNKDPELQAFETYLTKKRTVEKIAVGAGIVLGCLAIGFLIMLGFSFLIP